MFLICDTESDDLKYGATKIWCMVAYDPDTNRMWYSLDIDHMDEDPLNYENDYDLITRVSHEHMVILLNCADTVVFHNGYNHDLPLIKKFYPNFNPKRLEDTFVLSSLFNPDRPNPPGCKTTHSIEAWGLRFGEKKVGQEQWKVWERNILTRCVKDVKIGYLLWKEMEKERRSWDWETAIDLEYECALLQGIQEMNGVKFDLDLANKVLQQLDKEIAELDEQLYLQLPMRCVNDGEVKKPFKKDGELNANVMRWMNA